MRHGGDLAAAEAEFGRPAVDWLDLSTGVNPYPYPLPRLPARTFTKLPASDAFLELLAAARAAYGWRDDLPVVAGAGSQAMIQLLPYLRVRAEVAIVGPTYGEHAFVWARAGHTVRYAASLKETGAADVVIVVNPDNPSGRMTRPDALAELGAELARRDGLLVVDEAFADVTPESALGERLGTGGIVVLRSFGKFFGLPGMRLGFAAGDEEMVSELAAELGPWAVSGPALAAGRAALADEGWIAAMRLRLSVAVLRLDGVLATAGFEALGGTDLFRTVRHPRAREIHAKLARAGIWVRAFDDRENQLRFGLPADDEDFDWLASALASEA